MEIQERKSLEAQNNFAASILPPEMVDFPSKDSTQWQLSKDEDPWEGKTSNPENRPDPFSQYLDSDGSDQS